MLAPVQTTRGLIHGSRVRIFAKLMAELREKADIEIDEAALADDALWQLPAEGNTEGAAR